MLLARKLIFFPFFSLLLFKSQFFLSCQIQISVLQYFLVWPQPAVCWRNLLDNSLIQMIKLNCVPIETVLIWNRKMAFCPNGFLFSMLFFWTNWFVPESRYWTLLSIIFEDFPFDWTLALAPRFLIKVYDSLCFKHIASNFHFPSNLNIQITKNYVVYGHRWLIEPVLVSMGAELDEATTGWTQLKTFSCEA